MNDLLTEQVGQLAHDTGNLHIVREVEGYLAVLD
jgi:hypothetical protein